MAHEKNKIIPILIGGISIALLLLAAWFTNNYLYSFLPPLFNPIYFIYAIGVVEAVALILALMAMKNKSNPIKAVNFLKDTNKELHALADKSESMINAIGDGVALVDNDGLIKLFNPAAAQMLGWNREDAEGLHYASVLKIQKDGANSGAPSPDFIEEAIKQNNEQRPPTLSISTKNNKNLLVSLVVSPIGNTGDGVIVIFKDVTKEKAEEREQAEFISTASHEMRTPVASIEGYLGLALNPATATLDERAKDYIQKAQASAHHLGGLFQDLLDISRADDNRIPNNPQLTDVIPFVKDIVDSLKITAEKKGIALTFKPDSQTSAGMSRLQPVFNADVDQGHLRELVSNFIENAIKYTPQGEVTVDITGDSDNVTISISDTGLGIPQEDVPHLFQKFYRVDNTETNAIGGTGLGLYLAKKLAEIIEANLWVESEYGKGSTFFIKLARLNQQELDNLKSAPPQASSDPSSLAKPPTVTETITPDQSPMSNYTKQVPRSENLTEEEKAAYVAKLSQISQESNQYNP